MRGKPNPCAVCGGRCCSRTPGIYYPADVRPLTVDTIEAMLRDGCVLDYWCGDLHGHHRLDQIYVLRPRIVNVQAWPIHKQGYVEGQCSFLTLTGCKLPRNRRPAECRRMIVEFDFVTKEPNCHRKKGEDVNLAYKKWRPHQKILIEAADRCKMITRRD